MVELQTTLRDKEDRLAHTVVDYLVSPPAVPALRKYVSHACLQSTVVGCGSAYSSSGIFTSHMFLGRVGVKCIVRFTAKRCCWPHVVPTICPLSPPMLLDEGGRDDDLLQHVFTSTYCIVFCFTTVPLTSCIYLQYEH